MCKAKGTADLKRKYLVLDILKFNIYKGKRICLPHSEVMIHQPLGGAQGQQSDIEIQAKHILKTRELLNKILAENTGKDVKTLQKDTDRDNYMDAKTAVKYGLVDKIFEKR